MIRSSNAVSLGDESHVFVVHGGDRQAVVQQLLDWQQYLAGSGPFPDLGALSVEANRGLSTDDARVALVVESADDLRAKLQRAHQRLSSEQCRELNDVTGIYFTDTPMSHAGKLAFLFPGEASQYPGMVRGLDARFARVRQVLSEFRQGAAQFGRSPDELLHFLIADPDEATGRVLAHEARADFTTMWNSTLVANWVLHEALREIGVTPDALAGHSVGEFSVLALSGVVESQDKLFQLARSLEGLAGNNTGDDASAGLLAIGASADTVQSLLDKLHKANMSDEDRLYLAMDNCPHQSVVVGWPRAIARLEQVLREKKLIFERLPLDQPYHTPWFEPHIQPMREAMAQVSFAPPRLTIYSATTASSFPSEPDAIRELAVAHWAAPVQFTQLIRQMHSDGYRVFIEAGPRGNLHSFVQDTLRGQSFLSIPANVMSRSPSAQLNHVMAQLIAHRYPIRSEGLHSVHAEPENGNALVTADDGAISLHAAPAARRQVMLEFQQVMDDFLELQRDVMNRYLVRRRGERSGIALVPSSSVALHEDTRTSWGAAPEPVEDRPARPHPLLGEVVEFREQQRIVSRRVLDMQQDIYARDHAVGGQDISEVEPLQHGLPVVPMTFTIETMAALSKQLFPDKIVVRVEDIRLHRWLPYYEHDPAVCEAVAEVVEGDRRDAHAPADVRRVRVEVRDLGNRETSHEGPKVTAIGDVVLADAYPESPAASIELSHPRPSTLTLKRLYHNLFHGPRFRGVTSLDRYGDRESEGRIVTMPRHALFEFDRAPQFELDPVVLDVAMHVMAGWHLEHENQSGRLTLPFKLDSVELFGPCPDVGTAFQVFTRITRETSRQFMHDVEVFDADGRMHARYRGVRLWRFYLPVGEVNFHGPKNIYYLSDLWPEANPTRELPTEVASHTECVRLEPPTDLAQPAILLAASKVILSSGELAQYVALNATDEVKVEWLFARAAMKDAVRKLWERLYQRRMFAADVEIAQDEQGCWYSQPRNGFLPMPFPRVAYAYRNGVFVAVASLDGWPGVAVDIAEAGTDSSELVRRAAAGAYGGMGDVVPVPTAVQLAQYQSLRVATCLLPPAPKL